MLILVTVGIAYDSAPTVVKTGFHIAVNCIASITNLSIAFHVTSNKIPFAIKLYH